MMRKYVKKVLGFWGIILLRTIKGYFKSNNEQFKDLLLGKGFHLSIANNPFIVFNNYKSVLPTIYIHFYAQFVIKKVSFCIRRNCWKNDICLKLLRIVGLQQAYLYDIKLMFEKIPNRKPCTEIKIPENLLINERVVVYSVMIGNYDEVLDPVYVSDNCDYILFTDNANIKTNVWKVHLIEPSEEYSNKWNVLFYKILAHKVLPKKYDYSIYIDAKVFICGDIKQMFSFINKTCQFAMINHGDRNTLLEEIEACVKYKRLTNEKKEIALIQYNEYKLSGFRDNLGLVDTCILIRAHKDLDVVRAMDIWFSEFDKYPMRDQLSIMYSVWKSNVKYKIVDSSVWSNQFMIIKPHQIHTQS